MHLKLIVFARDDDYFMGVLQSCFHEVWALKLGTRLETRPRYTPTTCFETFPFPFANELQTPMPAAGKPANSDSGWEDMMEKRFNTVKEEPVHYRVSKSAIQNAKSQIEAQQAAIAAAARELNEYRERWLNPPEWTQTRTLEFPGTVGGPWARYLDPQTVDPQTGIGTVRYPRLEPRDADCAARLNERTLTNLYNKRAKGEAAWLANAHTKLDAAVAAAYGWPADLSSDEILSRLLELNLARAAAETATTKAAARKRTAREKNENELL